jgi:2-phospho-L-lactate guanylyltransferase
VKVAALVPFKSFTHAKQRLRTRYTDADVQALSRAMLEDVLLALTASEALDTIRVLTDDDGVAEIAEGCGARVSVRRPDPGLNAAIEEANSEAKAAGLDATLVVLGDLPLLRSIDVDSVVRAGRDASVVLVPSGDGGTAMLFRCPPDCLDARFGPNSAERHVEASRERGIDPVIVEPLPDLVRIDMDTPDDAERILESGLATRTVELLRKLRDR